MAVARQQVLVGSAAALQVVGSEDGHLHFLREQVADRDVKRVKLLLRLLGHKNYAEGC